MARKRKSRSAQASEEPETVQPEQIEPEPEQSELEETQQVQDEEQTQVVGDEEEEEAEEEEEEEEEEEKGDDGEEAEEQKNDVVQATTDEITEKPSDAAVLNGGEGEGDEDDEEPLEKLLEPFSKDQLTLLIKEAVSKHPDLAENVHRLADSDPSHRKIFVHGLGWEASDETITSAFGQFGEIEDCKVVKDKTTGKSKGYGFILFKHRAGARRALKEPQKLIDGRMASCQLASAGPVRAPPAPVAPAVSGPPESEYTRRKIYVSNVSAELDPQKLWEYFSTFGEIEEGPLGLDKQTGKPRGFCLFVYKTLESAKKALEEPHKTFEGHTLHCQKAVDGPKHTKGFFGQQQGQQHHHQGGGQGHYRHTAKKGRYSGGGEGVRATGGHLMAPNTGPMGYNPAVAPAAIGQAVAALLATQGAGLGIGNLLGGIGGGGNPQGVPPMMNNAAAYGGQGGGGGYGGQQQMQGGYGGQPQMGRGGVRPHQGGAPYMGPGR